LREGERISDFYWCRDYRSSKAKNFTKRMKKAPSFGEENQVFRSFELEKDFGYGSTDVTFPERRWIPTRQEINKFNHSVRSKSIYTVYWLVFSSDMGRGMLFPTLWLLVSSLGGTSISQGIAVSCYSMGRLIGSTLFGFMVDKFGYRLTFLCCNILMLLGAGLYGFSTALWIVYFAQIIIGLGAGR
jgi:hypothetical protein